jgi:hypothetical protein
VRRFVKENSLGLVFGLLFLLALIGQAVAGHATFNDQQLADSLPRCRWAGTCAAHPSRNRSDRRTRPPVSKADLGR